MAWAIEHGFWLKKEGYKPSTIERRVRILRTLAKYADLADPESVKRTIARMDWSEGTKELACDAYALLAQTTVKGKLDLRYSDEQVSYVFDKNRGHCWHCGKLLAWSNYGTVGARGAWEVDHSVPLSRGGTDYLQNLVPSCIPCNRSKQDLTTQQYSY